MMRRWQGAAGCVCVLLLWGVLLAACRAVPLPPPENAPQPETAVLQIGLASGAVGFGELVTAVYPQEQVALNFVVGSDASLFADLAAGALDAILVHHIPEGDSNWFNPVALDGLVLVVHPDNPVAGLTSGEAQAVFNGRVTNWAALGGPDLAIDLLVREPTSGARAILSRRIMGAQRVSINAQIVADDAEMATVVAAYPAAIGYSLMGTAVSAPVKLLTVDGIAATPNTTGTQTYPLTTPLYFVAAAEPSGPLRDFLAWVQSLDGQGVVGQQYGRVR